METLRKEFAIILSRRIRQRMKDALLNGCNLYWGEKRVIAVRCRKMPGLWAATGAYQVDCKLMGCGGQTEWRQITSEEAVDDSSGVLRWT